MDLRWIRPAIRPVSPKEVGELSPLAVQVLRALRQKFQYQTPRTLYQPTPIVNTSIQHDPLSIRFVGVRQNETSEVLDQECGGAFQTRAMPDDAVPDSPGNTLFLPGRQEPSSSPIFGGALSRSSSSSLDFDFPPISPIAPSTSNHGGDFFNIAPMTRAIQDAELSWEEISDISLENDPAESRKSFPSSPAWGRPSSRTHSALNSNGNSPMSAHSKDMDEFLISEHQKSETWNPLSDINEFNSISSQTMPTAPSQAPDVVSSNLAFSEIPIDNFNEIVAKDSIDWSKKSMTSIARKKLFKDNQDVGNMPIEEEFSSSELQDDYNVTFKDQENTNKSAALEKGISGLSSGIKNLVQESPQVDCTPPLCSSKKGNDAVSDMPRAHSFDNSGNANIMIHSLSENDPRLENSPHLKDLVLGDQTKTPDTIQRKKKKFLGTPFKRALSSTNILHREQSEENRDNNPSSTLQLDTRQIENREPLKSRDDNIHNSSHIVKGREEFSPVHTSSCSERDQSAYLPHSPSRTLEKTSKEATNGLYFPIFTSSSQVKRKTVKEGENKGEPPVSCKKKLKFSVPYKRTVTVSSNKM